MEKDTMVKRIRIVASPIEHDVRTLSIIFHNFVSLWCNDVCIVCCKCLGCLASLLCQLLYYGDVIYVRCLLTSMCVRVCCL